MAATEPHDDLPPQFALCEQMMTAWFETMLAATDQCFRFWCAPFALPADHAAEEPGDLDVPGPLERDHEHNLFA